MAEQAFKQRLERIADSIPKKILSGIEPLPFDKYLMMSCLQKGVRRGDVALAVRAALTLHEQDKNALWRRLTMIAVEDVAMGDLETTLDVLAAGRSAAWRKKVGSTALAVYLAQRMAKTVKTRYLTELYLYTDLSKKALQAHTATARASFKELASILHDPAKEAPEKVIALWGLFGSRRFGTKNFQSQGYDLKQAIKAVRALSVPEEILEVCTSSISAPHFLLTSLLSIGWMEAQRQEMNLIIRKETPVSSPEVRGLPMVAADGLYTRLGIEAIKRLKKAVPALSGYTSAQIGEGYFFIDAEHLSLRLTCDAWDNFRQQSIFATMNSLGLEDEDYLALHRSLIKHYDTYNDIRLAKVAALADRQPGLFT